VVVKWICCQGHFCYKIEVLLKSNKHPCPKLNKHDSAADDRIFSLVDADGSGCLNKNELMKWMAKCEAELVLKPLIVDSFLSETPTT